MASQNMSSSFKKRNIQSLSLLLSHLHINSYLDSRFKGLRFQRGDSIILHAENITAANTCISRENNTFYAGKYKQYISLKDKMLHFGPKERIVTSEI